MRNAGQPVTAAALGTRVTGEKGASRACAPHRQRPHAAAIHVGDRRAHRRAVLGAGPQPGQQRFPMPGPQHPAQVGRLLHVARPATPEFARPQGHGVPSGCAARPEALGHNNRERVAPGGPVRRMTDGPRATQAKAPKPRCELGCRHGVFRQRSVRIAEKPGQAPSNSRVVASG